MTKYKIVQSHFTQKGTASADVFNVYGNDNTVYANGGADRITVYKGKDHRIYGGAGKDTILVKKKTGIGATIYGGAGNDKVTVNGGSVAVYGDEWGTGSKSKGNDAVIINGGSYAYVEGGAGNDKITVNKSAKGSIYGGAGKDTIKVHAGAFNVEGGTGNDIILIDKKAKSAAAYEAVNTQIYGNEGNDSITITSGKNFFGIDGGAGKDTIKITGGKRHRILGGTGNDEITLKNCTYYDKSKVKFQTEVYGGAGHDTITVIGGSYNRIIGDYAYSSSGNWEGIDKFYVKSGTGHEIFTGWGNDKVYVSGGKNIFIKNGINENHLYTGNDYACGNDRIEISGGTNITFIGSQGSYNGKNYGAETIVITGGKGLDINTNASENGTDEDTITISGGSGKVSAGKGDNKVTINWTSNIGDYFISAGGLLDERVVVNNAKSTDFTVTRDYSYWGLGYVDHDYLIFTHKTTGAVITLAGWSEHDETTYGMYFTGDKKIVFSTPLQSPVIEAAKATPGYAG